MTIDFYAEFRNPEDRERFLAYQTANHPAAAKRLVDVPADETGRFDPAAGLRWIDLRHSDVDSKFFFELLALGAELFLPDDEDELDRAKESSA